MNTPEIHFSRQQSGFVLALCLVLLLIMTILGVTALNTTVAEEGMAHDIQETLNAFQNAETGMALSEKRISKLLKVSDENATDKLPGEHLYPVAAIEVPIGVDGKAGKAKHSARLLATAQGAQSACKVTSTDGCTRFYEIRSEGNTNTLARARLYGGGCAYTKVESGTYDEKTGTSCN